MAYDPINKRFYQRQDTIVDGSPGGDTVKQGFLARNTPALSGVYDDLNLVLELGTIGIGVPATETYQGLVRLATKEESEGRETGEDGPAVLVPESLFDANETRTGLAHGDGVTILTSEGGVLSTPGLYPGKMDFCPFSPAEIPAGWYFMNGDQYGVDTPQGKALKGLSAEFKNNWGIIETSTVINLPNFFYEDGRGFFVRAADGTVRHVGSVQEDMFQGHSFILPEGNAAWKGWALGSTTNTASGSGASASSALASWLDTGQHELTKLAVPGTHPSGQYGTARIGNETTGINIAMTPVIYLAI